MADARPPSPLGLPCLGAYLAAAPPAPLLFPPATPPCQPPTRTEVQAAVVAAVAASPSATAVPGGVLAVVMAGGQGSRFVAPTPKEPRLGTGHAVGVALAAAVPPSWTGAVLVLCADTPGVDGALLAGLLDTHRRADALGSLDEFNSGVVVADATALRFALGGLAAHPTGGGRSEYYVTDFVVAMADAGRTVRAAALPQDQVWRVEGANTVEELVALERRCEERERGTMGGSNQEQR
ncbi:hypothetical protein I4F81_009104 [Pyropia yezoensis]|uniref:Uncharacterized protein n=1 Tax=Pyropia yezoensis TaxID=2788 RepID=A0ACC3C934_PYRYE|nr:hypothetical protein I4F81_009104 [Neopyropia yezoensis]